MTQADGKLPTAEQIRAQMRTLKPLLQHLEVALTAAARNVDNVSISEAYDSLASLSEAVEALDAELVATEVVLGLPYERVINATFTSMFGPDD